VAAMTPASQSGQGVAAEYYVLAPETFHDDHLLTCDSISHTAFQC